MSDREARAEGEGGEIGLVFLLYST